jgi:hypothetical protein
VVVSFAPDLAGWAHAGTGASISDAASAPTSSAIAKGGWRQRGT